VKLNVRVGICRGSPEGSRERGAGREEKSSPTDITVSSPSLRETAIAEKGLITVGLKEALKKTRGK